MATFLCELIENPDIVIINTCCVTNRAEYKSRYAIRRALKNISPGGKVVVAGCYVNKGSSFFEENRKRLLLFQNDQKHEIFHHIEKSEDSPQDFLELSTDSYYLHTRVPVKFRMAVIFLCLLHSSLCSRKARQSTDSLHYRAGKFSGRKRSKGNDPHRHQSWSLWF